MILQFREVNVGYTVHTEVRVSADDGERECGGERHEVVICRRVALQHSQAVSPYATDEHSTQQRRQDLINIAEFHLESIQKIIHVVSNEL